MKISEIVAFLNGVSEKEGDIEMESITGFWVRAIPVSEKRVVVCAVGEGLSLNDVLNERKSRYPDSGSDKVKA